MTGLLSFMHVHLHDKHLQFYEQYCQNSVAVLHNLYNKTREFIHTMNTKNNLFPAILLTDFFT